MLALAMKVIHLEPPTQPESKPSLPQIRTQVSDVFGINESIEKVVWEISSCEAERLRLVRSAGFRVEGIFRGEFERDSKRFDVYRLAITRKEWELTKNGSNTQERYEHEEKLSFSHEQIQEFARVSGDQNPIHLDDEAAKKAGFPTVISHGLLAGSIFSKILATNLPGPGTVYLSQSFQFKKPILPERTLRAKVTVLTRIGRRVILSTQIFDEMGTLLLDGEAEVLAPS
jgi:3-hydroxybutyryl-CoA dehydratase